MTTRAARRAQARVEAAASTDPGLRKRLERAGTPGMQKTNPFRVVAFLAVVALVIGGGLFYAGNFLFVKAPGGPGASMDMSGKSSIVAPATGSINLRVSMNGFEPKVVKAKPGQELTFDWWNDDGAMHLENGVHTMVSDAMNLHESLPAQSHKTISFKAPDKPGQYDYWCDSCCGGKDNPGMHGMIEVEA